MRQVYSTARGYAILWKRVQAQFANKLMLRCGHSYSVCQVLICSVTLFRLIKYIPQRLEHRDRWVGALQNTEVPLVLINGPADPISGRHAADGYALLLPFPIWDFGLSLEGKPRIPLDLTELFGISCTAVKSANCHGDLFLT